MYRIIMIGLVLLLFHMGEVRAQSAPDTFILKQSEKLRSTLSDNTLTEDAIQLKLGLLYDETFAPSLCAYIAGPYACKNTDNTERNVKDAVIEIFMSEEFRKYLMAETVIDKHFGNMVVGRVVANKRSVEIIWWISCANKEEKMICRITDMKFASFITLSDHARDVLRRAGKLK